MPGAVLLRGVLSRLAQSLVTIWVLVTLIWVMFRVLPGDPTTALLGTGQLPPEAIERLREAWALNDPWAEQYLRYMANLASGEFGLSFVYREPALAIMAPALANTLLLMAPAVMISIVAGVLLGARLGWHRGAWTEAGGNLLVLVLRSLPAFWIGIVILMVFSYWLGWFPIGGIRTPAFFPETALERVPGFDVARHLVLPVAAAVLYFLADPLMIMRTAMLEARTEDFVHYARARGLTEGDVMRLARRNAMLPVITYVGIMISFAFGGQVLLEVVFSWPGMGRLMVASVLQRDYPVAQAAFLLMAVMVVLVNLTVDLAYRFVDPRIRDV
ncbi:MAG: ABC transporter permease [Alphaproteobacteria bacterium]|nr:ABC transporter permease [Alphaproteobacteria bacterium]